MLFQSEGSQAIARAIALCRPQVVCAYPISPQTHIIEGLENLVRSKKLDNCEYINVESEMGAISVAIGAEAAGSRSYTATSSQGLLYMIEAVYNAAGLELPIVMTLGNRAIGSPINIWNDHTDAMSVRDSGWIMLFAETNQEAADLHIQAFRIAEKIKCPVIVNVDGFILTHAYERVDIPSQKEVDEFLPPYEPNIRLDIRKPLGIGAMVPPEYFMEVRYLAHKKQEAAIGVIDYIGKMFMDKFGRNSGGLVHEYNLQNAEVVIVTLGSVVGTVKDAVDELNDDGGKFGVLSIVCYRPLPQAIIRNLLKNVKKIIVLEKSFAVGIGGILSQEIELAMKGVNVKIVSVIAGLGGRSITKSSLKECFLRKEDEKSVFLDLKKDIIKEYAPINCCNCK
jgi:pyruvate ferredoxin oxidoreductase alpha subunit